MVSFKLAVLMFAQLSAARRVTTQEWRKQDFSDHLMRKHAITMSFAISSQMFHQLIERELPIIFRALVASNPRLKALDVSHARLYEIGQPQGNSLSFHFSDLVLANVKCDLHMTWMLSGSYIQLEFFQITPLPGEATVKSIAIKSANALLGVALDVTGFRKYRRDFCISLNDEQAQNPDGHKGNFDGSLLAFSVDQHGSVTCVVKLRRSQARSTVDLELGENETLPFSPALFLGGEKAQELAPYLRDQTTLETYLPGFVSISSPNVSTLSRIAIWIDTEIIFRKLPTHCVARRVLTRLVKCLNEDFPITKVPADWTASALNIILPILGVSPKVKINELGIAFINSGRVDFTPQHIEAEKILHAPMGLGAMSGGGAMAAALNLGGNVNSGMAATQTTQLRIIRELIGDQVTGIYMIFDLSNAGDSLINSIFDSFTLQSMFTPDVTASKEIAGTPTSDKKDDPPFQFGFCTA